MSEDADVVDRPIGGVEKIERHDLSSEDKKERDEDRSLW